MFSANSEETRQFTGQPIGQLVSEVARTNISWVLPVLVIRHLKKLAVLVKPCTRGWRKSIGIIVTCLPVSRLAWHFRGEIAKHPERLIRCESSFLPQKIAQPSTDSLAFRLVEAGPMNSDVAVIQWAGTSPLSAQDLISEPVVRRSRAVDEAEQWLSKELAAGPRPAAEMCESAAAAGIARRTLKRALRKAGRARKIGFGSEGQ